VKASVETTNWRIILKVRDDGVGIHPEKIADFHSLRLLGMHERAAALGGSVVVRRNRTKGTMVSASLPLLGVAGAPKIRSAGE
jgi:signal transduction histidine kinase